MLVSPALPCPDCGARMKRRMGKYGTFYGCSHYPQCRGAVSCGPDGEPIASPADSETRSARVEAHHVFDRLWKTGVVPGGRSEAYRWLVRTMGIHSKDAHIGKFDKQQCARLVELASAKLRRGGLG